MMIQANNGFRGCDLWTAGKVVPGRKPQHADFGKNFGQAKAARRFISGAERRSDMHGCIDWIFMPMKSRPRADQSNRKEAPAKLEPGDVGGARSE